jgi:hypothetical protein
MKNNNPLHPQAKTDGLVIQELADEVLVYDLEKNKAYDLNQTSALVWQNCDGTKNINAIARELEHKLNQKVPDELVWLTLEKLKKEGLVDYQKENYPQFTGVNRRDLLKKATFASLVALPAIASLVAPRSAQAASGAPAPVCLICVKKSNGIETCASCGNSLGTCFDNAGCGGGQLVGAWTCVQCFDGTASAANSLPFNGTISWVAN